MRLVFIATLIVTAMGLAGCETVKPYEKEYLLSPVMDDARLSRLQSRLLQASRSRFEKLAAGGANSGSTSCPTCGG